MFDHRLRLTPPGGVLFKNIKRKCITPPLIRSLSLLQNVQSSSPVRVSRMVSRHHNFIQPGGALAVSFTHKLTHYTETHKCLTSFFLAICARVNIIFAFCFVSLYVYMYTKIIDMMNSFAYGHITLN